MEHGRLAAKVQRITVRKIMRERVSPLSSFQTPALSLAILARQFISFYIVCLLYGGCQKKEVARLHGKSFFSLSQYLSFSFPSPSRGEGLCF